MLLKFSQALLRFIMCITYLIAFLPCTLHAMPTHHALQRLYMLPVLRKGSEMEGSAGVVLEWVKHFFFKPDIRTVWIFWVVFHSQLTRITSPKDKCTLGKFTLHRTENTGNIVFLEHKLLVRKISVIKSPQGKRSWLIQPSNPHPWKWFPPQHRSTWACLAQM